MRKRGTRRGRPPDPGGEKGSHGEAVAEPGAHATSYASVVKRRRSLSHEYESVGAVYDMHLPDLNFTKDALKQLCIRRKGNDDEPNHCVQVQIGEGDLEKWYEHTSNLGVCIFFMGKVFKGMQVRAWVRALSGETDPMQTVYLGKGFYFVKCRDAAQKFALLSKSASWACNIFGITLPWDECFDPAIEFNSYCPVWITLKDVPIFLLPHIQVLTKDLGRVLYMPQFGNYVHARIFKICVLWNLEREVPSHLEIPIDRKSDKKEAIYIRIFFDNFPLTCFRCKKLGHYARDCPCLQDKNSSDSGLACKATTLDDGKHPVCLPNHTSLQDTNPRLNFSVETLQILPDCNPFSLLTNAGADGRQPSNLGQEDNLDTRQPSLSRDSGPSSESNKTKSPTKKRKKIKKKNHASENKENLVQEEGNSALEQNSEKEMEEEGQINKEHPDVFLQEGNIDADLDEEKVTTVFQDKTNLKDTYVNKEATLEMFKRVPSQFHGYYKDDLRKFVIPARVYKERGSIYVHAAKNRWDLMDFIVKNNFKVEEVILASQHGNITIKGAEDGYNTASFVPA